MDASEGEPITFDPPALFASFFIIQPYIPPHPAGVLWVDLAASVKVWQQRME